MKSDFLKLECRIQRWNTTQPCVFLIDTNHPSLPTAVYNRNTFESMDNIKGQRPRPLKTHAYNFNRIQDEEGNTIIESRATDRVSADRFVKKILEAAKPIDQQEYLRELDQIIWPSQEDRAYKRVFDTVGAIDRPSGIRGLDFIAQRSHISSEPVGFYSREMNLSRSSSARKQLLRQLTDLISEMDEEDLLALLKFAQTLAEG